MSLRVITQNKALKGKVVLVRVDYNVDMRNGKVMNTERIERTIPLISYLRKRGAKIVLLTHFGRPSGRPSAQFSVRPLKRYIKRFSKAPVSFSSDCIGDRAHRAVARLRNGQVLLMENLRFHPGEEANDPAFARELSRLGDVYVNEAFSMCHRAHASIVGIPLLLPGYAGLNLAEEVRKLQRALKGFKRPAIAIIGGAKISTKIAVIQRLGKKYNHILIGGALANTFFAAKRIPIGASLHEHNELSRARSLLKAFPRKIILPVDVVVARRFSDAAHTEVVTVADLKHIDSKTFYIVDIGPKTGELFASYIAKAETIIWNGPMGLFEKRSFANGTIFISQRVAERAQGRPYAVIGGGETISAVEEMSLDRYVDYVSTGGGALLAFLGGSTLPGITYLLTNKQTI